MSTGWFALLITKMNEAERLFVSGDNKKAYILTHLREVLGSVKFNHHLTFIHDVIDGLVTLGHNQLTLKLRRQSSCCSPLFS